jgi:hypothetical protein
MAEPVGTRQCSPLRFDERAEERAALTEPASSLPAAKDMKRGTQQKKFGLRAKGEMPSFRFRPTRAAQDAQIYTNAASSLTASLSHAATKTLGPRPPDWHDRRGTLIPMTSLFRPRY